MNNTRNLWPAGVMAAFALFIAGTAGLVVMACAHKSDLVAASYYEDEIRFQSQVDRTARARRLGSNARVAYEAIAKHITISLPPEHARNAAKGQIQLYRPSQAGLDRQLELRVDSDGRQTIDAAELKAGLWEVKVTWTAGGADYFLDQKIVIGPAKPRHDGSATKGARTSVRFTLRTEGPSALLRVVSKADEGSGMNSALQNLRAGRKP